MKLKEFSNIIIEFSSQETPWGLWRTSGIPFKSFLKIFCMSKNILYGSNLLSIKADSATHILDSIDAIPNYGRNNYDIYVCDYEKNEFDQDNDIKCIFDYYTGKDICFSKIIQKTKGSFAAYIHDEGFFSAFCHMESSDIILSKILSEILKTNIHVNDIKNTELVKIIEKGKSNTIRFDLKSIKSTSIGQTVDCWINEPHTCFGDLLYSKPTEKPHTILICGGITK